MIFASYKTLVSHTFSVKKLLLGQLPGKQRAVPAGRSEMNAGEHSDYNVFSHISCDVFITKMREVGKISTMIVFLFP